MINQSRFLFKEDCNIYLNSIKATIEQDKKRTDTYNAKDIENAGVKYGNYYGKKLEKRVYYFTMVI